MSMSLPEATPYSQPMPTLGYATPAPPPTQRSKAQARAIRLGDRYLTCLCLCLLGYSLMGRGFAYIGVNPLFIGEIMLLSGVAVLMRLRIVFTLLRMRVLLPLLIWMCWGLCRTVPFLEIWGKDAVRDAVFWGYGTFSFIMAGLLITNPLRLQKLVVYMRKFVILYMLLAPISSIALAFFEAQLPMLPWADGVTIIMLKGGDICVHLSGCFAYIVALGNGMNPWIYSIFMPLNLALNIQGRAGMVAFAMAVAVLMVLKPFHPRAMRIFFVIGLGLFAIWLSDIHIQKGARELSFDQLVKNVESLTKDTGDDSIDGSKEWRQKWWSDIIGYTFHGPYFWTGKGFGVNLATDDGYDVDAEQTLRSPHNGHMTVLARTGVPGLTIWVILHLTWATLIIRCYFKAKKARLSNWAGWFTVLGVYWAAFITNAAFDVFLEGPMGGIWMWCIYGAGIGSVWLYRRYPNLLTPNHPAPLLRLA